MKRQHEMSHQQTAIPHNDIYATWIRSELSMTYEKVEGGRGWPVGSSLVEAGSATYGWLSIYGYAPRINRTDFQRGFLDS